MTALTPYSSNRAFEKALEQDRRAAPLASKTMANHAYAYVRAHPLGPDLQSCTAAIRREVLLASEEWRNQKPRFAWLQNRVIEPMADRFLNRLYLTGTPESAKITLFVQDLGGFGDLIFGVRELKTLQERLPQMQVRMLTGVSGAEKLRSVFPDIFCPIVTYNPNVRELNPEAQRLLHDSDLILVSPTISGVLPEGTQNRGVTILEYNRPDYGLDVRNNTLMTGIGRNTLGIFLDEELRGFAKEHFPQTLAKKAQLVGQLDNRALCELLQVLGMEKRSYFGYGNHSMDRFLDVVTRYEGRLDEQDAVVLAVSNSGYKEDWKKKLGDTLPPGVQRVVIHRFAREMTVFRALQKEGIALDLEEIGRYREKLLQEIANSSRWEIKHFQSELTELDEMIENAKKNPSSKPRSEFKQSLDNGLFFTEHGVVESSMFAEVLTPGKTVHVIAMGGLSMKDSHRIKKAFDEICLSTGDQSLTEDVSLDKLLMYDLRKREPVEALWRLAQQNQFPLAAKFFQSFVANDVEAVVECLLQKGKLREEIHKLYAIIDREMDFAPELVSLVKRRLAPGQTERDNAVHALFVEHFLSPRPETLLAILSQTNV